MSRVQTIYIELLHEGVACWRPVAATRLQDDIYEIPAATIVPVGERWAFNPGETVRCSERVLSTPGNKGLVAVESVKESRPSFLGSPVSIPSDAIGSFCQRWSVQSLSLFGSALRPDFGPASDIDVLVRFQADAHPTLFTLAQMKDELEALFSRPIDLLDEESVAQSDNPVRRRRILDSAKVLYAA